MTKLTYEEHLANAIQYSSSDKQPSTFDADGFFTEWFRERGRAYFFLFKKNLSCTNLQFAEFLALLRQYVLYDLTDEPVKSLHFKSRDHLLGELHTVAAYYTTWPPTNLQKHLATLLRPKLRPSVVIEPFYGSCAVFIPPHLRLDISAICSRSGYVHSCGRHIITRDISQVTADDLSRALGEYISYLRSQRGVAEKEFFSVFSHEDFSLDERNHPAALSPGLDNVKIHLEKAYVGEQLYVFSKNTL
jgi:hypothetical protein